MNRSFDALECVKREKLYRIESLMLHQVRTAIVVFPRMK